MRRRKVACCQPPDGAACAGLCRSAVWAASAPACIGSIIAEVCGRERMYEAMDALDLTVQAEGIALPDGSGSRSIN